MRNARLIWLMAVAAACGVALGASPALAAGSRPIAAAAGGAVGSAVLQVGTVPAVPGAQIILDGVTHLTDAAGTATIATFAGRHRLAVLPPQVHRRDQTVRFSRWLDGIALASRFIGLHQGLNRQQAGFELSYPIRVRFTNGTGRPVPMSAVKRLTMASSLGQRFTFAPARPPRRLAANRIVRDQFGLHALPIRYSVREVIFNGANVVYGGSQSFFVRRHRVWTVRLLLFPMHIEVRDALFGFAVGSAVRVRLGDGQARIVRLGAGHAVTLSGMPRATYELVAKGPGFGLSSPATLTKPLNAKLLLLSWVDLAAVAGFALLFLIGLPLVGGRIRRRHDGARLPGWHVGHPDEAPAPPSASAAPSAREAAAGEPGTGELGAANPTAAELAATGCTAAGAPEDSGERAAEDETAPRNQPEAGSETLAASGPPEPDDGSARGEAVTAVAANGHPATEEPTSWAARSATERSST